MKTDWQETRRLAQENLAIAESFNFRTFKTLSFLSAFLMVGLLVALMLAKDEFLGGSSYKLMYAVYAGIFLAQSAFCLVGAPFVRRHTVPLLYFTFFLMHCFAMQLNHQISVLNAIGFPYTITLGFLLIQPFLILDSGVRIAVWNVLVIAVCSVVAVLTKSGVFMVVDLLDTATFGITGIVLGEVIRTYIISFIYMKIEEAKIGERAAQAENEAKSTFLAHMSHEIRTPLNAVLGLNELILREAKDSSIQQYAGSIKSAGNTLLSIINDVLDFSKISANELTLIPAEYHLDSMINDLLALIIPRANEKALAVTVNVDKSIPNCLCGDELRIKQCILNLLTNAVKYTNTGGITVRLAWKKSEASPDAMSLFVSVKDTGTGIKKEDVERLFTPFERLNEKANKHIEGTGLGMPIVQGILKKMNSELQVKSEFGVGSEFSFWVEQGIVKDTPIGNYEERSKSLVQGTVSAHGAFTAPDVRILVVDDLKMNLDVIKGLLKATRMKIDTATGGQEAVKLARQNSYDIIFIDHRMPVMDGVETLRALLQIKDESRSDRRTVYVALTANAIQGSREYYLNEGFDDYLSKPVDVEKLEALIMQYLPADRLFPAVQGIASDAAEAADDAGDCGADAADDSAGGDADGAFLSRYRALDGVDVGAALGFCGEPSVLMEAVREFAYGGRGRVEGLGRFLEGGDLKNYTVSVHALKTALRIIGFSGLSTQAAELEAYGNGGDGAALKEFSPNFLKAVAEKQNLCSTILEELGAGQRPTKAIPPEQYRSALEAIAECARANDAAQAADVLSMVEAEYELPESERGRFTFMKQAARNGNCALLLKLADEAKGALQE